jgi:hypothetical protein
MAKEIILRFNRKTGEAKVEAMGFKGNSCQRATDFLAKSLGQVTDFQQKAEWFETNLELNGDINTNHCG